MEYYSTIKRNEPLILATIKMNLKCIMLSEISQTKLDDIIYDSIYMNF